MSAGNDAKGAEHLPGRAKVPNWENPQRLFNGQNERPGRRARTDREGDGPDQCRAAGAVIAASPLERDLE